MTTLEAETLVDKHAVLTMGPTALVIPGYTSPPDRRWTAKASIKLDDGREGVAYGFAASKPPDFAQETTIREAYKRLVILLVKGETVS